MNPPESLFLIDGNAYIHRAYHALPPLTNSRGEPVQALFGFARMLLKILKQQKPEHIAVCFDTPAPTFRHKAYKDYKATRKRADDALVFQLPLARDLVQAWGFPMLALEGYEADDLIATLAERAVKEGMKVVVVTGDKDALQLVTKDITVLNEHKGITYTEEEVKRKYGLEPGRLVDFFALTGDTTDNVPGVPGVGPKTALQILQQFGTLEQALQRAGELKGSLGTKIIAHRENAKLSKELVTLNRDVPIGLDPKDCHLQPVNRARLQELFTRFEFSSLLSEIIVPETPTITSEIQIIRSETDLLGLIDHLKGAQELALEVVATGSAGFRSELVGIALALDPKQVFYIPIGHDYLGCPDQLSAKRVLNALSPFLEDPKILKIGHDLKFANLALRRHNVNLTGISFDTLIASYCLNPSRATHSLHELAREMIGKTISSIDTLIGTGAKQTPLATVEVETLAQYAGAHVETVISLKAKMAPLLKEKRLYPLFCDVEMPLVGVLADMEATGIRLDMSYLKKLQEEFAGEIESIEGTIREMAGEAAETETVAGEPLNLNSPKQLAVLLFEKLKLPVVRRTKTGYSTDEEVLKKLSGMHPLPAKILEYRGLTKLKSTYIDALLSLVEPETGRVHTNFNQAITATGRLSSSEPNLQNIPIRTEHGRRIRRAFVPQQGWLLLSADYSQIDLRVLAHISGDPVLSESFRQGEDIHSATAREIFALKPGEPVTVDQRRIAKTVNFGIVYGQTAFGLSQQIGLPPAEAQRYIDRYFARYAGVKNWIERILAEARHQGFVTTLLKRLRYLPEILAPNASVRAFAERTAMNTPIQGTSADIIKLATHEVVALLREKQSRARLLLQVHDELLFETPREELPSIAALIRDRMQGALELDIPLAVDLKTGENWADMEKFV